MRSQFISWVLLVLSIIIFCVNNNNNILISAQCLNNQSSLLLQLRQTLHVNSSFTTSKLASWVSSTDCCSWLGVICDSQEHHVVVGLDLSSEMISGGIDNSSSLFNLGYLQSLNLAFNNFNSTVIPSGFGRLANLTHLNLSNSGFAGQIPIDLSHLTRLVSLDLSVYLPGLNSLKLEDPDLKTLVRNLSELEELRLDRVNISAEGSKWCQALSSSLPNLQVLSLSNCNLLGPLDSSLAKLRFLSEIRLDQNFISAIVPDFFENFSNLTSLHLGFCNLSGNFPEKVFQLKTLQVLDISNNQHLRGSLPEFPQNSLLQTLVLSSTNFSGQLPNSIGNLSFLSKLELVKCGFSGSIPSSMGKLAQLIVLDLTSNSFTGPIPLFGLSQNLTEINLAHNRLTGTIVSSHWEKLLKLVNLDLRNNSLGGSIPSSLFTLPLLQKLQLAENHFDGQLGEFLNASSSMLDTIDLSSNKLEGPIPKSIFELQSLNILTLSSNNFSGTLQLDMIQKLRNLSSLDLSYNSLVITTNVQNSTFPQIGTLKLASCNLKAFPDFSSNQSKLSYLDLSDNKIQGSVPKWIWNAAKGNLRNLNLSYNLLKDLGEPLLDLSSSQLAMLDLHSNLFQGPIPFPPPSASYLDYSNNNFSSIIPANISSCLNFTNFFSLSSNKLTGEMPASICNASYLQVLDLSNNRLQGTISPCLGNIGGSLSVLNLRQNGFHGIMPMEFPSVCSLRTLDLNGNSLEGQLSKTLANCTMLEVLDLGENQINDTFPFWLGNLSQLRVLVLRSNKFYGSIQYPGVNYTFPMLQIIDISSNHFTGELPLEFFMGWDAMEVNKDKNQSRPEHDILKFKIFEFTTQVYYQDVVTVTSKGLEMELVKILNIFTSVDFSNNSFQGEIPEAIGNLTSLYVLNLSSNAFTGEIPSSLGNLELLESLDLSHNKLTGLIPLQLANLTFLSVLDLSWNYLVGTIPQGSQFQTFTEESFKGNRGLCGHPLSAKCVNATVAPSPTSIFEDKDSKSVIEFDWEFILTGLGFGGGAGMVVGSLMFWKKGRQWYDEHVDRFLLVILPLAGLFYNNCDDGRIEAEETMGEELMEMTGHYDDDADENSGEGYRGRFCVLCSKLDKSGKGVIHSPDCNCHVS